MVKEPEYDRPPVGLIVVEWICGGIVGAALYAAAAMLAQVIAG